MDPVKIPQNVYVEDRIVGPLSLRQLIIIIVGGGFSYLLFAMVQRTYGNPGIPITILIWTPAVIAAAFALVKINDLSMLRICFLMIERMQKSSIRTWVPRKGITINIRFAALKPIDPKVAEAAAEAERTSHRIRELSSIIDQPFDKHLEAMEPVETETESIAEMQETPQEDAPAVDTISSAAPTSEQKKQTPPAGDVSKDGHGPVGGSFSDLSVFRDIFSPPTKWQ